MTRVLARPAHAARDKALLRLRDAHVAEFDVLYDEELAALGLPPTGGYYTRRAARRARRERELRKALGMDGVVG